MKNTKKILLCCLCVVAIVAGSVLGTLAYLTDRSSVENTFTVGNVDITVDEEIVNPDGTPTDEDENNDGTTDNDRTEKGNEYHLLPGETYMKDPTMTVVKGSEESYVRMMVTINCYSELQTIFGDDFLPENYVTGWDNTKWPCVGTTDNGDNTVTYEFRYHTTVDAYEAEADMVLEPLFTSFTIPGELTGDEMATISALKITVEGHAIQVASFEKEGEKTAEDVAWAAFDVQYEDE